MKKIISNFYVVLLALLASSYSLADDHAAPPTAALEAFFCNFEKGRDMGDLMKVTSEWDKWMDSNSPEAYNAFVMSPVVNTGADFPNDYFWLGVAKNHEAMGNLNDFWMANGGKLADKFDAVAPCDTHIYMTSQILRPGENAGQAGFAQISACELKEDANMATLMAADKKWVSWMDENNMPGGLLRWYGGVGEARDSTTDFYSVYVADTLAQRGKAHDMMIAGGAQVLSSIYDDVMDCDVPRIYYGNPVGGKSAG